MFTERAFDPNRKPRPPGSVESTLRERENFFNPKIGDDEDGFTLRDAETLGWNVDLFHASKPFPGRGLVEVRAGSDVLDSNEGRYGVLKAIYEFELREHQRAQARAREVFGRLVRAERLRLGALNAARAARKGAPSWDLDWSEEDLAAHKIAYEAESHARREAIQHLAKEVEILKELEQFTLRELPNDFIDYLKETKPLDAARED